MRLLLVTALALSLYNAINAVSIPTTADMLAMYTKRIENIKEIALTSKNKIDFWKTTLSSNGVWADVNYTSGCGARAANWPIIEHLNRTRSLAGSYLENSVDVALLDQTKLALDYWFNNDFVPSDCVMFGGEAKKKCPCGTPGLWSENWFNQAIRVPSLVGDTCLLLRNYLSPIQTASCAKFQFRAFQKVKGMKGANLLDISSIGISLSLFKNDSSLLRNALTKFYNGVFINSNTFNDGIQSDGSFMQHGGLLYNGNYGKDFINSMISVFIETKGTNLVPPREAQIAFETLLSGSEWMIMADSKLNKLLWQYSSVGRMISFKYSDEMSTGGVAINIKKLKESAEGWDTEAVLDEITDRLNSSHVKNANQGNLVGTRYFYNADYMIHRSPSYIATMKMYSSRTVNSECVNAQNPRGVHLSDGAIFNYISGDEYLDVFGSWNWELVPGITVDIGGTPLRCDSIKFQGKRQFVGGATDGNTGIAVLDFQNPINSNLKFKKTVFFFPSAYAVQVGPLESKNGSAPLVTVLDQRKRNGDIYVAGVLRNTDTNYTTVASNSIWHDNIGYYFPIPEILHVDSKTNFGSWSEIGISKGTNKQQLWTSYIKHSSKFTTKLLTQYVVQPNIQQSTFHANINRGAIPISLDFHANDPQVNAAYSEADKTMGAAFWTPGTYETPWNSVTITADSACIILLHQIADKTYRLTTADPSHKLAALKIAIRVGSVTKSVTITLPVGPEAGKAVAETYDFTT